jgi:hypothetical protein
VGRTLTDTLNLESPFHSSLLTSSRLTPAPSDVSRHYHAYYVRMGVTDALAVFLAMLLAYQLRFDRLLPTLDFWLLLLTVPLITPLVYLTMRLYRVHQISTAEEFRRIILAVSLIISATVMVSFWSKASFSRLWMLLSWGLALVLALSVRRLWHWRSGPTWRPSGWPPPCRPRSSGSCPSDSWPAASTSCAWTTSGWSGRSAASAS